MTVQQLIDTLEQVQNKGLQVVISGTDHTDFLYHNTITEEDIVERNVFEEDRDQYRRRLVINGGQF
jgi:predicted nicotinamide N-methyase